MRVLSLMDATNWATLIYAHGSNVPATRDSSNDPFQYLSLKELAKSTSRSVADPMYSNFLSYYNDKHYADSAMELVLQGKKWSSVDQRSEVIAIIAVTQILYMQIIGELHAAVNMCNKADPIEGLLFLSTELNPWDKAAAMIIGSMEGALGSTDSDDGELLWNLANNRAFQFNTANSDKDVIGGSLSVVNSRLFDLLYAGKGEMDALDCKNLAATASLIERLINIPVMQSAIKASIEAETSLSDSANLALAQGEAYTSAILPVIDTLDKESSELLRENLIVKEQVAPVRDGAQEVSEAFGYVVANGLQLRCQLLGATAEVDPCVHFGGRQNFSGGEIGARRQRQLVLTVSFLVTTMAITWMI